MHTVVETPSYLAASRTAGISDAVRAEIVLTVARDPLMGELMQGTHGLRKFRHARPGQGKSGSYRIISYFHSDDLPVFLITAFAKNERANLSDAEAAALGSKVKAMVVAYRKRTEK